MSHPKGLFFGKYGSIVSASPLKSDTPQADGSCTLEIWLEPSRIEGKGTVLGFYRPGERLVAFAIRQYQSGLVFERPTHDKLQHSKAWADRVYVDKVFSHQGPVLVTITSNQTGTTVYGDGALLRKFADFGLSREDLTGRVVIGNSPVVANAWSGKFRGFAIYEHELTSDEVSHRLTDWTESKHPDVAGNGGPAALYLFDEGQGNVVHNRGNSATDLVIPEHFFVLDEPFLELPWDEFRPGWRYWKNIGINIAGFIPLGFFFCAYFSSLRKMKRVVVKTIALGFAVSLTIEVLQAFLPTRDSGMTDLVTNTLGTAVGVITFRYNWFPIAPAEMELRIDDSSISAIAS
jgi:VanZ like family/Concanavalin A-like lectin/glucanases superfamily